MRRPGNQTVIWAVLLLLAALLAAWCIAVTVTRQRERDEATNAAVSLCRQVAGLGRRCSVDPTALPWAQPVPSGQAVAPLPPPLVQPLPPRNPGKAPTGSGSADESVAADPVFPGPDAAVSGIQLTGGRLILTYTDGARVDAGPADGSFLMTFTPAPLAATPDRSAPVRTPTEGLTPTGGGVGVPHPTSPGGSP